MRSWRERPASLSSYELIDAPLYCVLTRVQLRYIWALLLMLRLYFQVRRDARRVRQLKRCVFLIENFHTFFILSIWEDEDAFVEFGGDVMPHLTAARQALSHAARAEDGRHAPAIWSTEWRIRAASHNLNWGAPEDWDALWSDVDASPAGATIV